MECGALRRRFYGQIHTTKYVGAQHAAPHLGKI